MTSTSRHDSSPIAQKPNVSSRHHTSSASYRATGSGTTYARARPTNTPNANTHDCASSQANRSSCAAPWRARAEADGMCPP